MKVRKRVLPLFGVAIVALSATAVLAHGAKHNNARYTYMQKNAIPMAYRDVVNPMPMNSGNLAAGKSLYDENCAACHGTRGDGKGEAAEGLNPPPAALSGMYEKPMTGMTEPGPGAHLMHGELHHHPGLSHADAMGGLNLDAYNFWAVSEGGEPMGSSMPAFKEMMTEQQRWQVLLYLVNGLSPDVAK